MPTQIPSNAFKTREEALKVLEEIKKIGYGIVEFVSKKRKKENPPPLHSLTSLQREANKLYGFSAQKTLSIAQKLYETHKVISYPRTDSQYLAESNKSLVKEILKKLGKTELISAVDKVGKRVFNNAKLTDHHAIIPLAPPPQNLTPDERKIYDLILRKFVGAFMPPYEYEITTVVIRVGKYKFGTQGKRDISLGWKSLYKETETENKLPELKRGDKVKLFSAKIEKHQTTPPPRYTEAKILKLMEKLNLGTPATRASILETLKKRGYVFVSKKGKELIPTEKGKELIRKISNSEITSPEMTSKWEQGLENIYRKKVGFKGYQFFIDKIKEFVKTEIDKLKDVEFIVEKDEENKVKVEAKRKFKGVKRFKKKFRRRK
jgi:DNA topoisomerase-3